MTDKIFRFFPGLVLLLSTASGITVAENGVGILLRCDDIHHLLAKFDQAVERQSVDDIVVLMADDAVIRFKQPDTGQETSMTRMEFREFLHTGFQAITNFEYMRTEAEILLDKEKNTATASFMVKESFTTSNTEVHTRTRETVAFAIVDKMPVITKLTVVRLEKQQREKHNP